MNKALIKSVETNAVKPEYYQVTLRLLQAELWTVETGLYSNPGDHGLVTYRGRVHRAIENIEGQIREL